MKILYSAFLRCYKEGWNIWSGLSVISPTIVQLWGYLFIPMFFGAIESVPTMLAEKGIAWPGVFTVHGEAFFVNLRQPPRHHPSTPTIHSLINSGTPTPAPATAPAPAASPLSCRDDFRHYRHLIFHAGPWHQPLSYINSDCSGTVESPSRLTIKYLTRKPLTAGL